MKHFSFPKGYITLMGVLVISAIASTLALALIFSSMGGAQMSLSLYDSNQAKAMANYCAEEALQALRDSPSYTGSQSLTLDEKKTCEFTLSNLGGESRQLESIGHSQSAIRKVKIEISSIEPKIQIASWQEVADF